MKLARNELCHCGSGKKYKKCCLESDQKISFEKTRQILAEDDWEEERFQTYEPSRNQDMEDLFQIDEEKSSRILNLPKL